MFFDSSASPGKPTTRCRTDGVFGQNVCQRLGELAIQRRNVCAATHDLSQKRQTAKGRSGSDCSIFILSLTSLTHGCFNSPQGISHTGIQLHQQR
jgi:hypothetical protein